MEHGWKNLKLLQIRKKKQVLILAHEFYPLNNGGTFRLGKFAKYLINFGWEVVVVAPDWRKDNVYHGKFDSSMVGMDPCEVIRVTVPPLPELSNFEKKLKKLQNYIMPDYSLHLGGLSEVIYKKSQELCQEKKFDAIFASSLPHYILWVGSRLHRDFGIPWVADHRDIIDHNIQSLPVVAQLKMRLNSVKREARLTKNAAVITTVSDALAYRLKERNRSPVHVIMNGFDEDDFQGIDRVKKSNETFNIVYAGSLFGNRDPKVFLDGIDLFFEKLPDLANNLRIEFYGKSSIEICPYIEGRISRKIMLLQGNVTHRSALEKICQADALYFMSHKAKGFFTGKLFEYLCSGRPILSVPGDGDVTDKLINEVNAGVVAGSTEEVANQLNKWLSSWKLNGSIPSLSRKELLNQYSRKSQANKLANILDGLIHDKPENN